MLSAKNFGQHVLKFFEMFWFGNGAMLKMVTITTEFTHPWVTSQCLLSINTVNDSNKYGPYTVQSANISIICRAEKNYSPLVWID